MKKKFLRKQLLASAVALSLAATLMPTNNLVVLAATESRQTSVAILNQAGVKEAAFVTWAPVEGAKGYAAYVKAYGANDSQYVRLDDQLIRNYGSFFRADALGLAAGSYQIKVEAVLADKSVSAVSNKLTVSKYDRTGFAWVNGSANGAYNADGTLKSNAVVLYLTEDTKDTMTMDVVTSSSGATTSATGITNILALYKKGYEKRPLDIRVIGKVTNSGLLTSSTDCKGDLLLTGSGDSKRLNVGVTIEGIGEDATAYGWGIRVKNASNVEIRNIGVMMCNSSEGDDIGLQQSNDHVWVHNCDLFYGEAGGDSDQAKGDGALDCKKSTYVTFSYNHFWDNGKSNLLGLSEGTTEGLYITYHHNWYDHSDSRHPRVRYYSAHVYNNYYDGNSKYGVGSTLGSSVFVEGNYFRNCPYPIMTSMQGSDVFAGSENRDVTNNATFSKENGGTVKAYNNVMTGSYTFIPYGADTYTVNGQTVAFNLVGTTSTADFDAVVVSSKNEKISSAVTSYAGANTYNNFDTSSAMYSYTADAASDVPVIVTANAGRMNGGDFSWTFTEEDDASYTVNTALKNALKAYQSGIVSIGGGNVEVPENPSTDESEESKEPVEESKEPTEESKEPSNEEPSNPSAPETQSGSVFVQNFTESGMDSEFFTISGNLSKTKGTVEYNGMTLTQCLKIESATSISFTTTKDAVLTLVFGDQFSKGIKIDGTKETVSNGILTVELTAGTHTITKADTANLFYMSVAVADSENEQPGENPGQGSENEQPGENPGQGSENEQPGENPGEGSENEQPGQDQGNNNQTVVDAKAGDLFVSPSANGTGKSAEDPADFETALSAVKPGATIWMAAGNYSYDHTIIIAEDNKGNENAYKAIKAYGEGQAVLDFSAQALDSANRGVILDGSYWVISGVTFYGAGDNGMLLSGDHNVLDQCRFDSNRDSGLQISRYNTSYDSIAQWPSYNLIKNCAAYNNCDASGENADGFAAKLTCGEGNVFDGCLSYNNSDDGWDLYAKSATGPIGVITIKNCVAFRNGTLLDGTTQSDGDRNGFKLGGSGVGTPHIVVNCLAFENGTCGFTDNNNPTAITLKNCTSINNGKLDSNKCNYNLYREKNGINENLISYTDAKIGSDNFEGTLTKSVYYNKDKGYYYQISDKTAVSGKAKIGDIVSVTASDFVSLTLPSSKITDFQTYLRNEDGTVNLHGLGQIVSGSKFASFATDGKSIGARLSGEEKIVQTETPQPGGADVEIPDEPTPTDPTPVDPVDPTPVDPTPGEPEDPTPVDPTPDEPEDPTPADPTPSEPEVSESDLTVTYIVNNWGSDHQVVFKIENKTNSEVESWKLQVKKNDVPISASWNVNIEENGAYYVITPFDWNARIIPGGVVEFGVQGKGVVTDGFEVLINGKSNATTPENPTPVDPTPENPTPVDPTPGETEDPTPVDPEDPTPDQPENPSGKVVTLKNVSFGKAIDLYSYDYRNISKIVVKFKGNASAYSGSIVLGEWNAQLSFDQSTVKNKQVTMTVTEGKSSVIIYKWWSDTTLEIESVDLIY